MPTVFTEHPFTTFCDECDWQKGSLSWSEACRALRKHEDATGHEVTKGEIRKPLASRIKKCGLQQM